ncbi:MAG: phage minor head protein [Syntrophobacteraceae bacterium]
MTRREAAYNRKVQQLIDSVGKLDDEAVARCFALLEAARKEIAARIAVTEWQAYSLPQLKDAVSMAMQGFALQYKDLLDKAGSNAWNAGLDLIDWPLHYAGIRVAAPEISRTALEIIQGYSADLVSGLTADAIKSINIELAQGILGQKTTWQVMQGIGANLDDKSVFKNIATRAEAIARTELARINSAAREARLEAVVASDPKRAWQKKWISSGKFRPRINHLALNGKIVPVKDNFPGGLPYPHAPGLPAGEVVNCGCTHVLTLSGWEKMDKKWKEELYSARAIYD